MVNRVSQTVGEILQEQLQYSVCGLRFMRQEVDEDLVIAAVADVESWPPAVVLVPVEDVVEAASPS